MEPIVSVILPTRGHAKQAVKCINKLFATTQDFPIECIVIAYKTDAAQKEFEKLNTDNEVQVVWDNRPLMDAWNLGASMARANYLHASSDDFCYAANWLSPIMKHLQSVPSDSYVKINSTHSKSRWWAEIGIGHRDFFRTHLGGVLVVPHYKAIYVDVEISERARSAGVFSTAPNSFIEHRWNGAHPASTAQHDRELYDRRLKQGFPNDYGAIIT